MFECGDSVVYPMYGAGLVESVEEKTVDGVAELYYHISIPTGNLRITLSAKKAGSIGLRRIMEGDELERELRRVSDMPLAFNNNWNQRYKENLEKIKTGQLVEVAEVVRRLVLREKERTLSGAEKKMLTNAKQIVVSEMAFSKNLAKEQAEDLLMELLMTE